MDVQVEKVDHEDIDMRKRIFDFLAPHETYCLFITGNLKNCFPDSHIYIASRGKDWVGVAGFYGLPNSIVLFSFNPEAARALTLHVAELHPGLACLCAISPLAEPACDELRRMKYELTEDPRCVFMQLDEQPPPQPFQELVRPMAPADHESVARLHRYLQEKPQDSPITEDELRMVRMNPSCRVLAMNGEVVSTATTNGLGISAFQIIGVATSLEHRNKGYARAVCASLIRVMWDEGARQSILFTGVDNLAAQACYKKLGFRTNGEYWVARLKRIDD
jgi:ribosomal protein S18 acetylase RimI-like enzyme